ncbi:adenine nucleotide alpha hydrolases-like protein [Jackrogersella minutella]|nr:adenine nucleotide alpha hydrolases-like protein [Jackrogersella minutella]
MAADGPLNVVALVSGGKDSFYSILHCLANGHRVIALANLHPPSKACGSRHPTTAIVKDEAEPRAETISNISTTAIRPYPGDDVVAQQSRSSSVPRAHGSEEEDEVDLNSFMYQTVGHQVIPLYAQATGLPLFRQSILGTAVDNGISYQDPDGHHQDEDETESLIPLLSAVLKAHPEVNALCSGAILSTYQRTRVESVALRLGLNPLAYLWQYPALPLITVNSTISDLQAPKTDDAQLLRDMIAAGLVPRIVKVASAGLGEEFLWENAASETGILRIRHGLRRFGGDGGRGAVLGEGGEFETLVADGPPILFKGRIVVNDDDKKVVREGGGSAWLSIREAKVEMKTDTEITSQAENCGVRIPNLLDSIFKNILGGLSNKELGYEYDNTKLHEIVQSNLPRFNLTSSSSQDWYFVGLSGGIEDQIARIVDEIRHQLHEHSLPATAITNSVIVLRRMMDFPTVNRLYGALFREPNPPARVTISCGDFLLPQDADIAISLAVQPHMKREDRRGLHVQSRSYWAPANIGPYSQAITYPVLVDREDRSNDSGANLDPPLAVSIAGQIPLVPASMTLPSISSGGDDSIQLQVTLALQHLWRVGAEMQVRWWSSAVAYFPRSPTALHAKNCALLAAGAWKAVHELSFPSAQTDTEEGPDLWDRKYNTLYMTYGGDGDAAGASPGLPDWEVLKGFDADDEDWGETQKPLPYVFSAEVEELPRSAGVEWHAHLGFANVGSGSIRLYSTDSDDKSPWNPVLHHVAVGSQSGDVFVQSVAVYGKADEVNSFGDAVDRAAVAVKKSIAGMLFHDSSLADSKEPTPPALVRPKLTYVRPDAFGLLQDTSSLLGKGAIIPCRSLWDSQARPLDMVSIFETTWVRQVGQKEQ